MSDYVKYNGQQGCVVAVEAHRIRKGDRFLSDRASEGEVEVLYDFGKCPHDDRPESVYVREYGTTGDGIFSASWFIAIPRDWLVHLTYFNTDQQGE